MKVSPNDNTTDQKNCEKYVDNNKKIINNLGVVRPKGVPFQARGVNIGTFNVHELFCL